MRPRNKTEAWCGKEEDNPSKEAPIRTGSVSAIEGQRRQQQLQLDRQHHKLLQEFGCASSGGSA
jgi:hypothetical protein